MNSLKILDVFIGNRCNLTCFQCDTRSDLFRKGELDPDIDTIKDGINLARSKFNIETYSLLGGEPLMYLDKVEEILKFIRSFDPTTPIMIPSNGALIHKHVEKISDIIKNYKIMLVVCNHYSGFIDQSKSNKLRLDIQPLIESLNFDKVDPLMFFNTILDWDNTKEDPLWERFLKIKGHLGNEFSREELYLKDKHGLFFKSQDEFAPNYYINSNGAAKPFDSPSASDSYLNGCGSLFCTFLNNKKLYKCAALGTLNQFLTRHNLLEDPDWQKYLNYKPLDLEKCSDEEVEFFSKTKYSSIKECTMCPHVDKNFIKTPETVIPGIIKRV